LREQPVSAAIAALEALRIYQSDSNLWEQVEMLVEGRSDQQLLQALQGR
jgi:hypothetical protein